MVKLTSVSILKYNGPDKDPYILGFAADLSSFGFFQKTTVKEMLMFVSRTVARKTLVGQRQTVQQEEYFCHVHNRDGLIGIAFVDHDYPARAGFCVVNKILEDYQLQRGEGWRGVTEDSKDALQLLEDALVKYQVCPYLLYVACITPTNGIDHSLPTSLYFCCRILLKLISWQKFNVT